MQLRNHGRRESLHEKNDMAELATFGSTDRKLTERRN